MTQLKHLMVRDVMHTDCRTVRDETSLSVLEEIMDEAGTPGMIPMINENHRLTGLVSKVESLDLGCHTILAVDNNYLAVQTARRNIRLNQLQDRILAVQGMAENCIDISADLMIANIHYDVMRHLIASPGFMAKKYFILSGLLRSQAEDVELYLDNCSVDILNSWSPDGIWHTFLGTTITNNALPVT